MVNPGPPSGGWQYSPRPGDPAYQPTMAGIPMQRGEMPGYGPPLSSPSPSSGPPRRRGIVPWILGAVAVLLVIAIVAVAGVWWTHRSSDESSAGKLLAGQLSGAFPTAPTAGWKVSATQFGGDRFISVDPSRNQYLSAGTVRDDATILTMVGQMGAGGTGGHQLVGIDAHNGNTWRAQKQFKGCADTIVDHRIACYDDTSVTFVDTTDGRALANVPASSGSYAVAYNGDAAFLRSFTDGSLGITKLTPKGVEWTKRFTLPDGMPAGDSSAVTATPALYASGGGNVVVISARDGHEILNRPGSATLERLPDGSIAVVVGDPDGVGGPTYGPVTVVHPDGSTTEIAGREVSAPEIAGPDQSQLVLVGGRLVSATTGSSTWTATPLGSDSGASLSVVDQTQTVVRLNDRVVAADTATGRPLWTAPVNSGYSGSGTTDGTRFVVGTGDGGVTALDLRTGTPAWTLAAGDIGNTGLDGSTSLLPPQVVASGGNLVAASGAAITGLTPTGGPATVPGAPTASSGGTKGGDSYVTRCGTPPIFTPQQFRTSTGGLVVTMKVTAKCPHGDVLSGPQTSISISDAGHLVAAGVFDFSRTPAAIPEPSSGDGGSITMDLTYPPGSFFRLPDTLGTQTGGTASTGHTYVVECDPGPQTGTDRLPSPAPGSPAPAQVAARAALPPGTDLAATTGDALRQQADADRAFILANLNNHWVAQLSSKRPGLVADGRTWDDAAILDEFLRLRLRFNDVRLLWSDEWSVFSEKGWWVTVAAATFPGPAEANSWCAAQGFDGDHCFAKLVSTTAPPDGSTVYRR